MSVFLEVDLELDDLGLVLSDIDVVCWVLVKAGKNTCPAEQLWSRDR